jgi:hypothetical protein
LRDLVLKVWERYGGEVMITETSHIGERRGAWLREVAQESEALLLDGVPLRGVCLYPILGMPEWHEPEVWTPMGLWDPVCRQSPSGDRLICQPMLDALQSAQHLDELQAELTSGRGKLALLSQRRRKQRAGAIRALKRVAAE